MSRSIRRLAVMMMGLLVLSSLASACGPARHSPSVSGSPSASGSGALTLSHTALASPCRLFPLAMAQGLYANVKGPGTASGPSRDSAISECDYYGPNATFYVNDVSMEGGTVQAARSAGGSSYKPPRQLAAYITGDPSGSSDTAAYAVDLSKPGTQAVFIFEYKQGGGSDQSVTWIHGDFEVSIDAYSQGSTGGTKSLRNVLIADALQIDSKLP